MKKLIILSLGMLTYFASASQTYVLFDRQVHKKVTLADTVTREDLSAGFFPVYRTEFDSLIVMIEKFRNIKDDGLNRKYFLPDDFKTAHIEFTIHGIRRTYGDGYEINVISKGPFGQASLVISDPRENLALNERNIRNLLNYLHHRRKELIAMGDKASN